MIINYTSFVRILTHYTKQEKSILHFVINFTCAKFLSPAPKKNIYVVWWPIYIIIVEKIVITTL